MKKIILSSLIILSSIFCQAQNQIQYPLPSKIIVCTYDGTHVSYKNLAETLPSDTIQIGFPYLDALNDYVVSGKKYFKDPSDGIFKEFSSYYQDFYTPNGNFIYPFVYSKSEAMSWADTSGLGNQSVMTEGRASNSLVTKMNKSDTIIYARKTYVSSLYQPKGTYITSESDPTVPSYSKTLTAFSVIKTSTDAIYQPLGSYLTSASSLNASNLASGTVPTARLGSGTADATKYLAGDQTWKTLPANYVPSINSATRTIATSSGVSTYTISSTLQATVYYNVTIACTASIGSNSTGTVSLQYSTNGGSTWITAQEATNSNTVTLAIALQSVTTQSTTISAVIPAGALVQLLKTSTGTTTITYIRGQEIY